MYVRTYVCVCWDEHKAGFYWATEGKDNKSIELDVSTSRTFFNNWSTVEEHHWG